MSYVTDKFDSEVVDILKKGGVGLLPSDTVYGLSCLALDKLAVERLHKLKKRSQHKPFIILISNLAMLNKLSIDTSNIALVKKYWPGALTVIFKAPDSPIWLHRGLKSLAVRMPSKPELINLIDECGPIISTSANLENQPTFRSAKQAQKAFSDKLDFYIDVGEIKDKLPSTIVKLGKVELEMVRRGAISID